MALDPILQLRDALADELSSLLGIHVEKVYAPYLEPEELREPHWLLVLADEETENHRRGLLDGEFSLDLALQHAHPDAEDRDERSIDTAWCDSRVAKLGLAKDLFRPGGALRSKTLAGCDFRRYSNTPIYRPDLLLENSIFTGVIRLIYYHEFNDED